MTVYGELLRLSVAAERADESGERSTAELALRALDRRAALTMGASSFDQQGRAKVAVDDVLSRELSYDVALVELCERLNVTHDLLGQDAGPRARRRAEKDLANSFPMLESLLDEE